MSLTNVDLNLLKVFRVVDETRHVTRAAALLGVTQPALSHALRRLRAVFDDALFVKSTSGMVLTPLAELVAPQIRGILGQLERTVFDRGPFRSEALTRTFRIMAPDMIESLLVPGLLGDLMVAAPGVRIALASPGFDLPKKELETGTADLAIAGFFGDLPDGFYRQRLFSDDFVCAVRRDHPTLRKPKDLTLDAYCEARHLLISPGGTLLGNVDHVLRKQKRERTVVAGASCFTVAGWLTAQSDCLLTAPSRLVRLFETYLPLRTFAPPLAIPEIKIDQVWHERNHQDPAHKWFRERVRAHLTR